MAGVSEMAAPVLPEIYCVIPHYGDDALLERCIAGLRAQSYPAELFGPDRLIVVDNNPPHPNRLFTGGVNEGIREARRRRRASPVARECLIWLLNNDTVPLPPCIQGAVRCFLEEGWERAGLVGCRNLLMSDPDVIAWGGSLEAYPTGRHRSGRVSAGDLARRTEEEWLTFAAVFLNERTIDDIGLLDRNLRHIASDSDYCLRARAQGWRCYYEPTSEVRHELGSSSYSESSPLHRVMWEDYQRFARKWVHGGALVELTDHPVPGVERGGAATARIPTQVHVHAGAEGEAGVLIMRRPPLGEISRPYPPLDMLYPVVAEVLASAGGAMETLLDLHCGDGRLAAMLRERLPIARYLGMEADLRRRGAARAHVDHLWPAPLEEVDRLDDGPGAATLDWVIGLDLLDGAREPVTALRRIRGWLRPGGRLLLGLRNPRYLPLLHHLVEHDRAAGDATFDAPDAGPAAASSRVGLPRYTLSGALAFLRQAGFRPLRLMPQVQDPLEALDDRAGGLRAGQVHLEGLDAEQRRALIASHVLILADGHAEEATAPAFLP